MLRYAGTRVEFDDAFLSQIDGAELRGDTSDIGGEAAKSVAFGGFCILRLHVVVVVGIVGSALRLGFANCLLTPELEVGAGRRVRYYPLSPSIFLNFPRPGPPAARELEYLSRYLFRAALSRLAVVVQVAVHSAL